MTMIRFRPVKTQPALKYIREGLVEGCTLSRHLCQRLEQETVRVGTWLPLDVPEDSLYQFTQGGKLPRRPEEVIPLPRGGLLVPIPNTLSVVARYLYRQLIVAQQRGDQAFLVAPDELASPLDPWLSRYHPAMGTGLLVWQEEVYFYARVSASISAVESIVRRARSLVGMFSLIVFARDGSLDKDWSPALVASKTRFFIVGAYDGESFLLVKFVV